MESEILRRNCRRKRRLLGIRKGLSGTSEKPRLCVHRTNKHIHVQLIDDESGSTLVAVSTIAKEFKDTEYNRKNKVAGKQLGIRIGHLAKEKNIKKIVFDRGRFKYHGVIAAVADGAREEGLEF